MVDWSNTLIAIRIYVVIVRNDRLIPANDVHGTIFCVDRRDRRDRNRRGRRRHHACDMCDTCIRRLAGAKVSLPSIHLSSHAQSISVIDQ
jgi:hypothetical protein